MVSLDNNKLLGTAQKLFNEVSWNFVHTWMNEMIENLYIIKYLQFTIIKFFNKGSFNDFTFSSITTYRYFPIHQFKIDWMQHFYIASFFRHLNMFNLFNNNT